MADSIIILFAAFLAAAYAVFSLVGSLLWWALLFAAVISGVLFAGAVLFAVLSGTARLSHWLMAKVRSHG